MSSRNKHIDWAWAEAIREGQGEVMFGSVGTAQILGISVDHLHRRDVPMPERVFAGTRWYRVREIQRAIEGV